MDFSALLKGEIEKKKKQASKVAKNGKIRASDVDEARLEELENEEEKKEELRNKKRKEREDEDAARHEAYRKKKERRENREERLKLDMNAEQVIEELRGLKEPVTLFGENEIDRYNRLKKLQRNQLKEKEIEKEDECITNEDYTIIPQQVVDDQIKVSLQLRAYIRYLLKKWQESNEDIELLEKTKTALEPLLNLLRHNGLEEKMFAPLAAVIVALQQNNYHEAELKYTDLSIGRKAWPVGVVAVGIHARRNLEKIQSGDANVMKSEITRQWITSIKRLITFFNNSNNTSST